MLFRSSSLLDVPVFRTYRFVRRRSRLTFVHLRGFSQVVMMSSSHAPAMQETPKSAGVCDQDELYRKQAAGGITKGCTVTRFVQSCIVHGETGARMRTVCKTQLARRLCGIWRATLVAQRAGQCQSQMCQFNVHTEAIARVAQSRLAGLLDMLMSAV